MRVKRIDHVEIIVDDLAAAKEFFLDLGLEVEGEAEMESEWLDKVIGLKGVRTAIVYMRTPDGGAALELAKFYSPSDPQGVQWPSPNTLGIRHIAFVVDDIDGIVTRLKKNGRETFSEVQSYEDTYKLCYVRGPEGIILELAEELR